MGLKMTHRSWVQAMGEAVGAPGVDGASVGGAGVAGAEVAVEASVAAAGTPGVAVSAARGVGEGAAGEGVAVEAGGSRVAWAVRCKAVPVAATLVSKPSAAAVAV